MLLDLPNDLLLHIMCRRLAYSLSGTCVAARSVFASFNHQMHLASRSIFCMFCSLNVQANYFEIQSNCPAKSASNAVAGALADSEWECVDACEVLLEGGRGMLVCVVGCFHDTYSFLKTRLDADLGGCYSLVPVGPLACSQCKRVRSISIDRPCRPWRASEPLTHIKACMRDLLTGGLSAEFCQRQYDRLYDLQWKLRQLRPHVDPHINSLYYSLMLHLGAFSPSFLPADLQMRSMVSPVRSDSFGQRLFLQAFSSSAIQRASAVVLNGNCNLEDAVTVYGALRAAAWADASALSLQYVAGDLMLAALSSSLLSSARTLTHLDLSNNVLTERAAAGLAAGLNLAPALSVVLLDNVCAGDGVIGALSSLFCKLRCVSLKRNHVSSAGLNQLASRLLRCRDPKLRVLSVTTGKNRPSACLLLKPTDAILSACAGVTDLDLSGYAHYTEGVEALFRNCPSCLTLQRLRFFPSAQGYGFRLPPTRLHKLDVTAADPLHVRDLFLCLRCTPRLRISKLVASNCKLQDEDVPQVVDLCVRARTEALDLTRNMLSSRGVRLLQECLAGHMSPRRVDLGDSCPLGGVLERAASV